MDEIQMAAEQWLQKAHGVDGPGELRCPVGHDGETIHVGTMSGGGRGWGSPYTRSRPTLLFSPPTSQTNEVCIVPEESAGKHSLSQ